MASRSNFPELEQRTDIKFRTILENSPKSWYRYLDDAVSYSIVRIWVNLFREGRASVEDVFRPERTKSATNQDKLAEVRY